MTQPPNLPPPPPPPGYVTTTGQSYGMPAGYAPPPAYVPPGGYGAPPGALPPAHGRGSPTRLILMFVVVLVLGLAVGGAIVLALQPGPKQADCPDPSVPCGQPPVAPTLPPIANASPTPGRTPAPTIVRPSGSLVISSAKPSSAPTAAPTAEPTTAPTASAGPSAQPSSEPSASAPPSTPPIANLPQPQPASNADALHVGTVWSSSAFGYRLEYDDQIWTVQSENANGVALSAGRGAVLIAIEGFKSSSSPRSLVQQKINALSDNILGLTEETDPSRQLPGQPVIGHRQGAGVVMNGTINQPQGPQANVDVVVLAATDNTMSIRVTVLTTDDLRDAAFAVADSVLNSIEWPGDQ